MNLFTIDQFKRSIKIRFLKKILRGSRVLKKNQRMSCISKINNELTVEKCIESENFSNLIFGVAAPFGEIVVRQYLVSKLCSYWVGWAIMYSFSKSNGSILLPLPPVWRNIFLRNNVKVVMLKAILIWQVFLFYQYAKGVVNVFSIFAKAFFRLTKGEIMPDFGRYSYFNNLTLRNIPSTSDTCSDFSILSWYARWEGRAKQLDLFCHDVPNSPTPLCHDYPLRFSESPLIYPNTYRNLFRYFKWGVFASTLTFFELFRGKWWNALMLLESAKMKMMQIADDSIIARDYLFHNSSYTYKPLWTYEVESKGSRVILYFYSTNCEGFKKKNGLTTNLYYGYQSMTWKFYLVWDRCQRDFIDKVSQVKCDIQIVGPIWFQDSQTIIPNIPKKSVAIFDVQPVRSSFFNILGVDFEYYVPEVVNQFLIDINEVLTDNHYFFVLKRKREIGKLAHPKYRGLIANMLAQQNLLEIDSESNAYKIIDKCEAVISLPFTSTALIAKAQEKPSVYYDPLALLERDDPAAHGIKLLQGKKELREWVESLCYEPH